MLFAAAAVHETLRLRLVTACLAAAAALLCHEAAAITLLGLPVLAWLETRSFRRALPWALGAIGITVAWMVLHTFGETSGAHFLPSDSLRNPLPSYAATLWRILVAQLDLEEWRGDGRTALVAGYVAVFAGGVLFFWVRDKRSAKREKRPSASSTPRPSTSLPVVAIAWLLLCAVPLSLLANQWQSWRSCFAALWLGIPLFRWLGSAGTAWAAGFVGVRLAALLLVAPPPVVVLTHPQSSVSSMSLPQIVRLQRTTESARRALLRRYPTLPRGATIRYWSRSGMIEVGFENEKAPRVWYGDSTITWGWLWVRGRFPLPADAVLSFEVDQPDPILLVEPRALRLAESSLIAFQANRFAESDSLLTAAESAQHPPSEQFSFWVMRQKARAALNLGQLARADSLNRRVAQVGGETADTWGVAAMIAFLSGDRARAEAALRRCLQLDPANEVGRRTVELMGSRPVKS